MQGSVKAFEFVVRIHPEAGGHRFGYINDNQGGNGGKGNGAGDGEDLG